MLGARFLSKPALGEYSIAMHLAMLPLSKLMSIVNSVAFPAIASLNRTNGLSVEVLLVSLRVLAHIVFPALWGLAAISPLLVPVALGPAWDGAILPLQIICLVLPLRLLSVLLSTALQGLGHAGIDLRNTITGVVVLPACFVAGSQFGPVGLATAWLVGLPLVVALNLRRAAPVLGLRLRGIVGALARPALVSGALFLVVYASSGFAMDRAYGAIGLLGVLTIGTLCYSILLWFLDRSTARQFLEILNIRRPAQSAID